MGRNSTSSGSSTGNSASGTIVIAPSALKRAGMGAPQSVSYTHLDVYKRQRLMSVAMPIRISKPRQFST